MMEVKGGDDDDGDAERLINICDNFMKGLLLFPAARALTSARLQAKMKKRQVKAGLVKLQNTAPAFAILTSFVDAAFDCGNRKRRQ
jgi:hypothetical protein